MKFKSREQQAAVMSKYAQNPTSRYSHPTPMKKEMWSQENQRTRAVRVLEKMEKPTKLKDWDKEIYIVTGRKWHDKVNGNTYHAVVVTRHSDGKMMYKSPMAYGYGDQWKHTAYSGLKKKGIVKEVDRSNHELNQKRFIYCDQGFMNQRDLKNW